MILSCVSTRRQRYAVGKFLDCKKSVLGQVGCWVCLGNDGKDHADN